MNEQQENQKQYKVEWSFSFEKLGDQIGDFFRSLGSPEEVEVKSATFTEAVGSATSARVRLDLSAGETNVYMLEGSDNLIDADLTYIGDINFVVGGETEKVVSLNQNTTPGEWFRHALTWLGKGHHHLTWKVGLTPNIPLELDIHGGVGECHFSLATLKPGKVSLNGGTGEFHVTLPRSSELYSATLHGGVGELDVDIPAEASVNLTIRAGTGEVNVDIGAGAVADITVHGGVGEVDIRIPQGAAVRVEGKAGIGDINVPASFTRISGSDEFLGKSGVWQSPNYGESTRKINIRYSGGVGALNVR